MNNIKKGLDQIIYDYSFKGNESIFDERNKQDLHYYFVSLRNINFCLKELFKNTHKERVSRLCLALNELFKDNGFTSFICVNVGYPILKSKTSYYSECGRYYISIPKLKRGFFFGSKWDYDKSAFEKETDLEFWRNEFKAAKEISRALEEIYYSTIRKNPAEAGNECE